jgi:hypothetical protein
MQFRKDFIFSVLVLSFLLPLGLEAQSPPVTTTAPAATNFSALNLLSSRLPTGLMFDETGSVVTTGDAWRMNRYSAERIRIHFNGETPLQASTYVEVRRDTQDRPSRVVMMNSSGGFGEFSITNASNGRIESATRCSTELARARPAKCWTVNRPICEQILRDANASNTDELMAKVRQCMDLKTAMRKFGGPLMETANQQFNTDIQSLRNAKELGERLANSRFEFENPSDVNVPHLWQKYIAIGASCSAILGTPPGQTSLAEMFRSLGYAGETQPERMPRPIAPAN